MIRTVDRVTRSTAQAVNQRIRAAMEERIAYYAEHPLEIDERLAELDREWDIERTIETNASALAFTGIVLGTTVDRRWLALPAVVTAFLFQHAVQGWCPPIPILRRMGVRTADEINQERYALKALRGEFEPRPARSRLQAVLQAVGIRSNGLADPPATRDGDLR
jgi:hypothetical protein